MIPFTIAITAPGEPVEKPVSIVPKERNRRPKFDPSAPPPPHDLDDPYLRYECLKDLLNGRCVVQISRDLANKVIWKDERELAPEAFRNALLEIRFQHDPNNFEPEIVLAFWHILTSFAPEGTSVTFKLQGLSKRPFAALAEAEQGDAA